MLSFLWQPHRQLYYIFSYVCLALENSIFNVSIDVFDWWQETILLIKIAQANTEEGLLLAAEVFMERAKVMLGILQRLLAHFR